MKIKENMVYFFTAGLATMALSFMGAGYVHVAYVDRITDNVSRGYHRSGYAMMGMFNYDIYGLFGILISIVSILALLFLLGILVLGVFGVLKAFNVLTILPDELLGKDTKKLAVTSWYLYGAFNVLLFVLLFLGFIFKYNSAMDGQLFNRLGMDAGIFLAILNVVGTIIAFGIYQKQVNAPSEEKTEEAAPAVEEEKSEEAAPAVEEEKTEEAAPAVEEEKTEEAAPAVEEEKAE